MKISETKKEVILSLVFKVAGLGLGFVSTAILIKNLGASTYGTWAAMVSLLAWVQLSDFGVGYALKNRIASAEDKSSLNALVAGVFQFYMVIALVFCMIFLMFGDRLSLVQQFQSETMVLYVGMILFFPLTIGAAILQGLKKNSICQKMLFFQSLLWLLCVVIIVWTKPSLLMLSIFFIISMLVVAVYQYAYGIQLLSGSLSSGFKALGRIKNFKLALPLWGIGMRFVALQLSSIVLFSLGTYLTYANLSPEAAAKYDILFKFFQIPITFFNVILSVYWPEIASAIAQKHEVLLKKKFIQLHVLAVMISLITFLFAVFAATPVIDIYSTHHIHVMVSEAVMFAALVSIQIFAYSGAVFLNAAEILKGQIILAVVAAALLVPLVLWLYKVEVGFSAVPMATAILIVPSLIYCNWSAYFHVIKKAH